MKLRTVLMTGAAALALTTNAVAGQGDTYVSIFGGFSQLTDTDLLHYRLDTRSTSFLGKGIDDFRARGAFNIVTALNYITTPSTSNAKPLMTFTSTGTGTGPKKTTRRTASGAPIYGEIYTAIGFSTVGTISTNSQYVYQREFAGSVATEGWVLGAAIGVELYQGLRGEIEVAFRNFDLNNEAVVNHAFFSQTRQRNDGTYYITPAIAVGTLANVYTTQVVTPVSTTTVVKYGRHFGTNYSPATVEGEFSAFSLMANLWYDFPIGNTGIVPFVGAGVGFANLTLDYRFRQLNGLNPVLSNYLASGTITRRYDPSASSELDGGRLFQTQTASSSVSKTGFGTAKTFTRTLATNLKTDQTVFAYQFGAGLGYEFSNGVRLTAQYRYFVTEAADFGPASVAIETTDFIAGLTIPFGRGR